MSHGRRLSLNKPLRSDSGQAVLEYILVLCITVMLILTFIYQFSTAFRAYANNYFGEYIACLLETGELPGGGGQCAEAYKPFNIADGKNAAGGSSMASSGSSSSSNSKSSSSSKSSKNKKPDSSSLSSSKGSSSTASNETGTSSSNSSSPFHHSHRSSTPVASSPAASDSGGKEGLTPLGPISSSGDYGSRSGDKRTPLSSAFGYDGEKEKEDREKGRPATKAVAKDESNSLKPQKVAVPASRAPASKPDDTGGGFSIGNFIRILLIAGILVLIFILFGSQLLAISKSGEK